MNREQAKETIKSELLCTRYLEKSKGANMYKCPFCGSGTGKEKTGAMKYYKDTNRYKCHKCGENGDILDLLQHIYNTDLNGALQVAAGDLNITIESSGQEIDEGWKQHKAEQQKKEAEAASQRRPITDYTTYYKQCKERLTDPACISYLQARGISEATAAAYYIGYDPAWISPAAIASLEEEGNTWIPAPSPRLIIPITSNHYIARDIRAELTEKQKTYAKANETGGGTTGLFNHRAIGTTAGLLFITEGAIDAMSIIEAGAAAIGLNSTNLVNRLLDQIRGDQEAQKTIYAICLDNDEAGRAAADKIKSCFDELHIKYIMPDIMSGCKDPNEALCLDRVTFEENIKAAQREAAKMENTTRPDSIADYLQSGFVKAREAAAKRKMISTGFNNLDKESGGFYPGLYVLAAISSLGKTTFAHQIADNLATAGEEVIYFSMEQSKYELICKSLAREAAIQDKHSRITSLQIQAGNKCGAIDRAAAAYSEKVGDRLSIIEGNFNTNISFIGNYVSNYINMNNKKPVVIIDYLQILQGDEEQQKKRLQLREVIDNAVTELKRLSRSEGITILVISSVNRSNYMAPIDFESLKESGGIEYTADVVWGLQLQCLNEDLFNQEKKIKEKRERIKKAKRANPREIELVCLKNRYGIANYTCNFYYKPAQDLFSEWIYSKAPGEETEAPAMRIR